MQIALQLSSILTNFINAMFLSFELCKIFTFYISPYFENKSDKYFYLQTSRLIDDTWIVLAGGFIVIDLRDVNLNQIYCTDRSLNQNRHIHKIRLMLIAMKLTILGINADSSHCPSKFCHSDM